MKKNTQTKKILIGVFSMDSLKVMMFEKTGNTISEPLYGNSTKFSIKKTPITGAILIDTCVAVFKQGLQIYQREMKLVPDEVIIYLDDALCHTVYRHHSINRKTAFTYTKKMDQELIDKDLKIMNRDAKKIGQTEHTVVASHTVKEKKNGYHISQPADIWTQPEPLFHLEKTFAHLLVPALLMKQCQHAVHAVFHSEPVIVYRAVHTFILRHLLERITGSYVWVRIGLFATEIMAINNGRIIKTGYFPLGISHALQSMGQNSELHYPDIISYATLVQNKKISSSLIDRYYHDMEQAWSTWGEKFTRVTTPWVNRGMSIQKVIYSYEYASLNLPTVIFPRELFAVWFGTQQTVFIPYETLITTEHKHITSTTQLIEHITRDLSVEYYS